jgi:DnaK suppressor protein
MTRYATSYGALRRSLLRELESIATHGREERDSVRIEAEATHGAVCDEGDVSAHDLQADLDLAFLEIRSEAIRSIERALERIASGTYGICDDCGLAIAPARLRALPAAERCHDCEDLRESHKRETQRARIPRQWAMPFHLVAGRAQEM